MTSHERPVEIIELALSESQEKNLKKLMKSVAPNDWYRQPLAIHLMEPPGRVPDLSKPLQVAKTFRITVERDAEAVPDARAWLLEHAGK